MIYLVCINNILNKFRIYSFNYELTLKIDPISLDPIDLPSNIPDQLIIKINSDKLQNLALPGLEYFPEYL